MFKNTSKDLKIGNSKTTVILIASNAMLSQEQIPLPLSSSVLLFLINTFPKPFFFLRALEKLLSLISMK